MSVVTVTSPDPAPAAPAPLLPDGGPVVAPRSGSDPDGHLADGWEAHRPLADGFLRRFVFAYATSFASVVHRLGGRVVRRDEHVVWDMGRPSGLLNGAMLLRPLPYDGWEQVIAELERDVADGGDGRFMLLSPFATPDLSTSGWHLTGHPPLLLRAGEPTEPEHPTPTWLELRQVSDVATLADWERVAIRGFPLADVADVPGSLVDERLLADPSFHAWVAYDADVAVAMGTSYIAHGLHVMWLGATLPSHRGRGIWDALAQRRLATFPSLPAAGLFSDLSRSPAQRLGFRALARWTLWSRSRDSRPDT